MLWAAIDQVHPAAWAQIERADAVAISAASAWEIGIKRATGRLTATDQVVESALQAGLAPLAVTIEHAEEAARLPPHHRDPFDRMLVAQARVEGMTLATADATLSAYDVPLLEVRRS